MKNSTIVRASMATTSILAVAQAKLIHDSNWGAGINVVQGVLEQVAVPAQYFDDKDVSLKDTLAYCAANAVGKAMFTTTWGVLSNINKSDDSTEESVEELMNSLAY